MDRILKRAEAIGVVETSSTGRGAAVPLSRVPAEGMNAVAAIRRTPGYDLVRVGNFTEAVGQPADIAFFHNTGTLSEIYEEETHQRQRLVRECCGALRDVCDGVVGYDAAKVTLFYERGAGSRFVRQKLLYNIWPVEQRQAELQRRADARATPSAVVAGGGERVDVRTDAYVYAYFYGLCVHKLAHFFDVVHGTRHDFYMTEYRANYELKWVELLLQRNFDPADVEQEWRHLLTRVVD